MSWRCFAILLCFWGAAGRKAPLTRVPAGGGGAGRGPAGAPPLVVFTTVALGGFRGLIADLLWLRVSILQDEGSTSSWCSWRTGSRALSRGYAEVLDLPRLEHGLQRQRHVPRSGGPLALGAQRLAPVARGGRLRYNPDEPRLYWQLGWLYLEKWAGLRTRAASQYKIWLADDVTERLGSGMPDYARLRADPQGRQAIEGERGVTLARMQAVEAAYGPLDWRLPETQALYWPTRAARWPARTGTSTASG